ncbi:MAG: hypothetical protein M1819_006126 [Sarea resinae]|nr:MAG: hypothetical protein M1819_006126 [Sarea resinae]
MPLPGGTPDADLYEIAGLMGEWYELLAKMRYFSPSEIAYPPHVSPAINTSLAAELGMGRQAVSLLQLLPYMGCCRGEDWPLICSGSFADFRDDDDLVRSRDPMFNGHEDYTSGWDLETGPYMRPWHVALNQMGNHGAVLLLNTRTKHKELKTHWKNPSKNANYFDHLPGRRPMDALRDYIARLRRLEWLPGGIEQGWDEYDDLRALYLSHGWPDAFDSEAFAVAKLEREHADDWETLGSMKYVLSCEAWWRRWLSTCHEARGTREEFAERLAQDGGGGGISTTMSSAGGDAGGDDNTNDGHDTSTSEAGNDGNNTTEEESPSPARRHLLLQLLSLESNERIACRLLTVSERKLIDAKRMALSNGSSVEEVFNYTAGIW